MQIKALYSHLNGEEFLLVHRQQLWDEIKQVIEQVDAEACKTKYPEKRPCLGNCCIRPRT